MTLSLNKLLFLGIIVLVVGGYFLFDLIIVNDHERVEAAIITARDACVGEDIDSLMTVVDPDYDYGSITYEQLAPLADAFFKMASLEKASITNLEIKIFGDQAKAFFESMVTFDRSTTVPVRVLKATCDISLIRSGKKFLITGIDVDVDNVGRVDLRTPGRYFEGGAW